MTDFPMEDVSMEDQATGMHANAIREGAARHPLGELSFSSSNSTVNDHSAPHSNSMLSNCSKYI